MADPSTPGRATGERFGHRLLWHDATIDADAATQALLRPLLRSAQHPFPAEVTLHLAALPVGDGGYVVTADGASVAEAAEASAAADALYLALHRRAFADASLRGWTRLHAATLDLDGKRVLVAGPSGTGKSTTAARVALDVGIGAVQGDESVLIDGRSSLAVPRPFHVKTGSFGVVPELDAVTDRRRIDEVTVMDLHSSFGGADSTADVLRVAPVDGIVLLAERGEDPVLAPVGPGEVIEALARDVFLLEESRADVVRRVATMVGSARLVRCHAGTPPATVAALRAWVTASDRAQG